MFLLDIGWNGKANAGMLAWETSSQITHS